MRGDLAEADRLARRGLEITRDEEGRWWCRTSLALVELSRGAWADAVGHAVEAAVLASRPDQNYGVAALATAYRGDLDEANTLNERMAAVAASPTLWAFNEYIAGEIDNAAGHRERAEEHYVRAIDLSCTSGATFLGGIAAAGLVTVRADAGRVGDALRGYRDLIEYWQRTGSWIQQWTTLRNLACLLHTLGDHESALFLEVAAEHAPEASAVSDAVWNDTPLRAHMVANATALRIRSEASSCTRARVLEVARQAIARHPKVSIGTEA
jgi:tetratricopeptide (TPR) repeat protein